MARKLISSQTCPRSILSEKSVLSIAARQHSIKWKSKLKGRISCRPIKNRSPKWGKHGGNAKRWESSHGERKIARQSSCHRSIFALLFYNCPTLEPNGPYWRNISLGSENCRLSRNIDRFSTRTNKRSVQVYCNSTRLLREMTKKNPIAF